MSREDYNEMNTMKMLQEFFDIQNEKDTEKHKQRLMDLLGKSLKGGTEDTFDISYKTLTDIERGISESCEGVLKDISENEFANATGRVISDAEELATFLCHICAAVETAIDVNSLLYEELKHRAFPESASDKTIKENGERL